MRKLFLLLIVFVASNGYANIIDYAEAGNLNGVKECISKGVNINSEVDYEIPPLMVASSGGHLEIVKLLVENGADVNIKDHCYGGSTSLISATMRGHLEVVKFLVENGANVNAENDSGVGALIYASHGGRLEIVKILVKNGANVNTRSEQDMMALSMATRQGHLDVVKYLKSKGAK